MIIYIWPTGHENHCGRYLWNEIYCKQKKKFISMAVNKIIDLDLTDLSKTYP